MIDIDGRGDSQTSATVLFKVLHGLARLIAADLLPDWASPESIVRRIDAMFLGAETLRRADGSLEESFPFESSYCVTALVAYDLLTAIELLDGRLSQNLRERYLRILGPMVRFVARGDESHGYIANHLATAATALCKWGLISGDREHGKKGAQLATQIVTEQSCEGWYREYDGADPGYQTLATYYLADLHRLRPDLELTDSLRRSVEFLRYFVHPDGSFGGYYGSRNTRFYCPAGIEYLSGELPEATSLAAFMRQSIDRRTTVTLDVLDEPSFVPMFNAYCWSAALVQEAANKQTHSGLGEELPALSKSSHRRIFDDAGLLVDSGARHYTVISWKKGGVCYHFNQLGARICGAPVFRDARGKLCSTQGFQGRRSFELAGDELTIKSRAVGINRRLPSPLEFALLRLLAISVFRAHRVREWFKRTLVRRLITRKRPFGVFNTRRIQLGEDCKIEDDWSAARAGYAVVDTDSPVSETLMAGQGFWQRQDDDS